MITDIVVDTLYDGQLVNFAEMRPGVEVVADPKDPEEIFYTPSDGYLVLRVSDGADAEAVEEELRRQLRTVARVVTVRKR